jgi:hypothetical protein
MGSHSPSGPTTSSWAETANSSDARGKRAEYDWVGSVPVATWQSTCPVCGGCLLPLGSFSRCSRCGFALCVGCEGERILD